MRGQILSNFLAAIAPCLIDLVAFVDLNGAPGIPLEVAVE
jgi:hypothetical protein